MKLKVCGMRAPDNIQSLLEIGPDFMGLIFFEKSMRFPHDLRPDQLPVKGATQLVGVFVNESIDNILEIVEQWSLDYVQLHGDEDVAFVKKLFAKGINIIKVFRVRDQLPENILAFEPYVDLFLFDTKKEYSYGGTGEKFDWTILEKYTSPKGYLLSGGIDERAVDQIKSISLPGCLGIDINSGVEESPGLKNMEKIKRIKAKL